MQSIESRWLPAFRIALLASAAVSLSSAADTPPDLRLRWTTPGASVAGTAGITVDLQYELTNAGGSAAFAVILKAQTTVGAAGPPVRVQPGPVAGASMQRKVSFALVPGMREICVDALLQTRGRGEPPEANLENNRICRAVTVNPQTQPEEAPQ